MNIKIGYDFNKNKVIKNDDHHFHSTNEFKILTNIINELSEYDDKLKIVSNTDDYLTLQYEEMDIARIKYTDRSQWISVIVVGEDKKRYINNPIFEIEKNKNKVQWKSKYNDDNMNIYLELIKKSIERIK